MNSIFHENLNEFIIIYVDDILIYSNWQRSMPNIWNMSRKGSKMICFILIEQEALNLQG